MKLGSYLKNIRNRRGWTQPEAAEKVGVEQSYLSKLENGKALPSEKILDDLVAALEINLDDMVGALSPGELTNLSFYAPLAERRAQLVKRHTLSLRASLIASLVFVALGGALVSAGLNETYSDFVFSYESKGVISPGETALIYATDGDRLYFRSREEIIGRAGLDAVLDIPAEPSIEANIVARSIEMKAEIEMSMAPHVLRFNGPQPEFFKRQVVGGGIRQYEYLDAGPTGTYANKLSINIGVFFLILGAFGFYVTRVWR